MWIQHGFPYNGKEGGKGVGDSAKSTQCYFCTLVVLVVVDNMISAKLTFIFFFSSIFLSFLLLSKAHNLLNEQRQKPDT